MSATTATHRQFVRDRLPQAICQYDEQHVGPGQSWAIYSHTVKDSSERRRITGGWMTPGQAWERAAAHLATLPASAPKQRATHQTIADLENMLRPWPRRQKLMVLVNGVEHPVRNIEAIASAGRIVLRLKTAREQ